MNTGPILPARVEFGMKILFHVPAVHALGPGYRVMIEPGDEALYPLASEWITVPRRGDDDRHGWEDDQLAQFRREYPGAFALMVGYGWGGKESRFVPEPYLKRGISADVVLCPRWRRYGSSKNWPHWVWLRDQLEGPTVDTFCAGAPDSVVPELAADIYELRFLDASIEAIRSAKLVVATDTGLAHLAVLCGAPLLVITYQDRTAPGPQVDARGHVMLEKYGPIEFEEFYRKPNHTGSPIHFIDGWNDPAAVVRRVHELIA